MGLSNLKTTRRAIPASQSFDRRCQLLCLIRMSIIYFVTASMTNHARRFSYKVFRNKLDFQRKNHNLVSLRLVQREIPYGEKVSKKSIYSIDDNLFRFWYRFVLENASMIARSVASLVYKRIKSCLSDNMGKGYDEICKRYLWKLLLSGNSPVKLSSLGRWWCNNSILKCQTEIDHW